MAINKLRVAVVGGGVIGKRRAACVAKDPNSILVHLVDPNPLVQTALSHQFSCVISSSWEEVIQDPRIDVVIISTPNHCLAKIAIPAVQNGKHILMEKPFGRNTQEAREILSEQQKHGNKSIIKVGFNHRFFPLISQAHLLCSQGVLGEIFSIRGRYGHGGRQGMEKEWRCSQELCGGGELLDQGVHMIDLVRWFAGEWTTVYGSTATSFWPIEVEDNAYVIGKTSRNVDVQFHVSWTNWKNIFSFEIFGKKGYLHIQGLTGHYGDQSLEVGIRPLSGGVPKIHTYSSLLGDTSWNLEWQYFKKMLRKNSTPTSDTYDGFLANQVVEAILQSNATKLPIHLPHDAREYSSKVNPFVF